MRIASRMMVDTAVQEMNDNLERLSQLQTQVASGKLIQTPADNPTVAVAGLSLRSTLQQNEAYINTGTVAGDWLDANETALKGLVDLATRARNIAMSGLSDTQGATERTALGLEIDGILQDAVGIANTQHQGKYIFAGFQVTSATPPFSYTAGVGVTGPASTVGPIQQSIAPGQGPLTINVDGNATFGGFFGALVNARNALLTQPYNANNLQAALNALDGANGLQAITDARTTNGARQRQVQAELDRLDQTQAALKNLLSHKEDINMAESVSMLKQQETVYQATLSVGQRAITPSLFDFLK